MSNFPRTSKNREITAKQRYDNRKELNLCTVCGLTNNNLPMVRCKWCYRKLLESRKRIKENAGYK